MILMQTSDWYKTLRKPTWAPPSSVFGPVWTILSIGIALSFGAALMMALEGKISWLILLPFLLNVIANVLFTPLQFGLKNNLLACIDVLVVLGTLIWAMTVIFPYAAWITYAQIPYLLWVSFATGLQVTITSLNSKLRP